MDKIFLILKREYSTRIRKKSFLIMTVFGPLIMLSMMIVPYWMSSNSDKKINILINDQQGFLPSSLPDIDYIHFAKSQISEEAFALIGNESVYDSYINIGQNPFSEHISIRHQNTLNSLELELIKLKLNQLILKKGNLTFITTTLDDPIQAVNSTKMFLSLMAAISIYFFIFLYGIQVMKGVIEEKNNRIIEVMISSVKPFQLMLGKIGGMAALAVTQFSIWMFIVIGGYLFFYNYFGLSNYLEASAIDKVTAAGTMSLNTATGMHEFVSTMDQINWPLFLFVFSFYFIIGYLIYSALFAIVGAASDVDTETQQFIMPITIPLLSTLVYIVQMFENPHGSLAKLLSIFPLTSPLAMMARLPFANEHDGFTLELIASMLLALLGFIAITYIASRIYRIGILSYGSKVSYKDLVRWFFIKD